jgi:membrane protease YdiL (CAAX protease family)
MKTFVRSTIRPVALTIIAPVAGFFLLFLLEMVLNLDIPLLASAIVNLVLVSVVAFFIFPRLLGIPFDGVDLRIYLRKLGFYLPKRAWRHTLLGLILAACTLSAMMAASYLIGNYRMDWRTVTLPHVVFSLNPALWEELFYRGVLMFLLLGWNMSLKKAAAIQVLLFGLMHFKGLELWSIVDVVSVMVLALGFTYTAFKTRSLLAGIVFHFFHDALVFFAQLPDGGMVGAVDHLVFYGLLWLGVGLGCLITGLFAERLDIRTGDELYIQSDRKS